MTFEDRFPNVLEDDSGHRIYVLNPYCRCEPDLEMSTGYRYLDQSQSVDIFQCDRCNRILILNFATRKLAWFVPESE